MTTTIPQQSPRGIRFTAMRALWILVVGSAVLFTLISIPLAFNQMITPCDKECQWGQLLPSSIAVLEESGLSVEVYSGIKLGLGVMVTAIYLATAVLIFWKRPADRGAWFTSLILALLGTLGLGYSEAIELIPVIGQTTFNILLLMTVYGLEVLLFVFPTGRFVPRWTRFIPLMWALQWGLMIAGAKLLPDESSLHPLNWSVWFSMIFEAVPLLIGLWAQIYRYRRVSNDTEKRQTKWVVIGLLALLALELSIWPIEELFAQYASPGNFYDIFMTVVPMVILLLVPATIAIAMLRHRLWDVDLLINRALVYTVLTAILAGVYLGSVALLQEGFRRLTGQTQPVAVMASTLGIAVLFSPLRRQVQFVVDKAFYRQPYDLDTVLATFGAAVRDQVDLNVVIGSLIAAIEQTLMPEHQSLWLSPSVRELQTGKPPLSVQGIGTIPLIDIAPGDPLLSAVLSHDPIIDADSLHLQSPAARAVREAGTDRIMVLVNQGTLLGLLLVGPRLSGQFYSRTDLILLDALARQAAPALRVAELVHRQQDEIRRREQFEQELRIARTVQKTLMPRELPQLPGWQLATYWQPARQIGGDFYDFVRQPDGRMVVVIGDVTGKGAPAALVMATCRTLLREAARHNLSPAEALAHANDLLQPEVPPGMFVTCQYVILDPGTGEFTFANAGHNLPVLARPGSAIELKATGMPLGLLPGRSYDEVSATLSMGDHLILYSDGLVEAHAPDREMYGEARMTERLAAIRADMGSTEAIGMLLDDLIDFTGIAWEQEDDVTFIALKRIEGEGGERTGESTLSVRRHTLGDVPLSELMNEGS